MEKGTLEDKNRSNFSCPKRTGGGDKLPKEEPEEDERQKTSLNRKRGKKGPLLRNKETFRRLGESEPPPTASPYNYISENINPGHS